MSTLKLSWQRARIVRDHLASRGIPETALDHEGRGARGARIDPRRCTGPRTVRARCLAPDRRVEIAVTKRVQP
jgi:outer membrane protein OmpA-like peptidoglycan-associated protein